MQPIHIVGLGIVHNPRSGKVLLGRRGQDERVPDLSWGFPGGYLSPHGVLEDQLGEAIARKTGLITRVDGIVHARVSPEYAGHLLLYYACTPVRGEERPGGSFTNLLWVAPRVIDGFVASSMDQIVINHLYGLGH